jgi:hypothetical protein
MSPTTCACRGRPRLPTFSVIAIGSCGASRARASRPGLLAALDPPHEPIAITEIGVKASFVRSRAHQVRGFSIIISQ